MVIRGRWDELRWFLEETRELVPSVQVRTKALIVIQSTIGWSAQITITSLFGTRLSFVCARMITVECTVPDLGWRITGGRSVRGCNIALVIWERGKGDVGCYKLQLGRNGLGGVVWVAWEEYHSLCKVWKLGIYKLVYLLLVFGLLSWRGREIGISFPCVLVLPLAFFVGTRKDSAYSVEIELEVIKSTPISPAIMRLSIWTTTFSLLTFTIAAPVSVDVSTTQDRDLVERETPLNAFLTILLDDIPAISGTISAVVGSMYLFLYSIILPSPS